MTEAPAFLIGLALQTIFVLSGCLLARVLAERWCCGAPRSVRWCGAGVLFCWILSGLFAVLATLHAFTAPWALAAAVAGLVLLRRLAPHGVITILADDARRAIRLLRDARGDRLLTMTLLALAFLTVLLTVRVVGLPVLGWDWMTYHGVKAGMWVQAAGWAPLDAPGGWEYYRTFFGGGEVFHAWAMVFLHSNLFAGVPDVVAWLFLGLAVFCLARWCGLQPRLALAVGAAFAAAPEFTRMAGSGYVDTGGTALLLAGLLFLLRYQKTGRTLDSVLSAAALGVAGSVKVNLLFAGMPLVFMALVLAAKRKSMLQFALVSLWYALPIVPWLLVNYRSTGYPLGCVPLRIGPFAFGSPPPNLAWFLDRPNLSPYELATEVRVLAGALLRFGPCLFLPLLALPGIFIAARQRRGPPFGVALLCGTVAALYYAPSFSVMRVAWPEIGGRFLAPVVILIAVTGLSAWPAHRRGAAVVLAACAVSALFGLLTHLGARLLDGHPVEVAMTGLSCILCLLLITTARFAGNSRRRHQRFAVGLSVVILAGGLAAADGWKRASWGRAHAECTTLVDFPRYWVGAMEALEDEGAPRRIAFCYGPRQVSHHAFFAPFLGYRLENRLAYVSPQENGAVPTHGADGGPPVAWSYARWTAGLQAEGCTHVLSLRPANKELQWMEQHPERFVRLAGQQGDWGLYRIEAP